MRAPLNPQFAARRLSDAVEENGHGCLCFFLGFMFGPIGLIVAAIVAKVDGLVSALWGFGLAFVLWCALIFIAVACGVRFY